MLKYPASKDLYHFVRLMLGAEMSDREIARRWKMDHKNFQGIKHGQLPIPKIERLDHLAQLLNISPYFLWLVSTGMSADWVYSLSSQGEPIESFSSSTAQTKEFKGEATELFKMIVQNSPLGIFGFDSKGNVLFWNRGCTSLYQFSESEMLGRNFCDFIVSPEKATKTRAAIKNLFLKKQVFYSEYEINSYPAQRRYIFHYCYPLLNESGKVMMGISVNMELKKFQRSENVPA